MSRYMEDPEYRERCKAANKRRYERVKNDPEFKRDNYARVLAWRKANPDKVKEYSRSEVRRTYNRKWMQEHPRGPRSPEEAERQKMRAQERHRLEQRVLKDPEFAATQPAEFVKACFERRERRRQNARKLYAANREHRLAVYKACRDANIEHYRKLARDSYRRRTRAKLLEGRN